MLKKESTYRAYVFDSTKTIPRTTQWRLKKQKLVSSYGSVL